jgi:hypothetical protein
MKNLKNLLVLGALFICFNTYGQSCKTLGTNLEEYNYVTKGYKVQIQSGLDMKKGYDVKLINSYEIEGRKVVYYELIKDGKDLRAIMSVFTGRDGRTSYFCIPLGDCDKLLYNSYLSSIQLGIDNTAALNIYQYTLTKVLSMYITK